MAPLPFKQSPGCGVPSTEKHRALARANTLRGAHLALSCLLGRAPVSASVLSISRRLSLTSASDDSNCSSMSFGAPLRTTRAVRQRRSRSPRMTAATEQRPCPCFVAPPPPPPPPPPKVPGAHVAVRQSCGPASLLLHMHSLLHLRRLVPGDNVWDGARVPRPEHCSKTPGGGGGWAPFKGSKGVGGWVQPPPPPLVVLSFWRRRRCQRKLLI